MADLTTTLDPSNFYTYTDPKTGQSTTYTSPEVAKQYGVDVPSVASMGNQTPLNIGTTLPSTAPTANPDVAGATVAGAVAGQKTLQDYINELTPPKSDTQTKADNLTTDISNLTQQDTGKAQAQSDAEAAAGVPDLKKQLTELNSQIGSESAAYDLLNTKIEGQTIPMNLIIGQQAQANKMKAATIGLLQARAQGLQGQLQLATDTATKAVDLKYSAIEDELNVKTKQLQLLQPTLTKEEKTQADALQKQYDDQKQQLQDQKDKEKTNITLALNNGVKTRYANNNGEFFDSVSGQTFSNPVDFFKAAGIPISANPTPAEIQAAFAQAYAKGLVTDLHTTLTADQQFAKDAQSKYYDVFIPPNSTHDQVMKIIQGSRIYKKDTYIAPTTTTDDQTKRIQAFQSDAANFITQFNQTNTDGTPKITWGDAWNALHAKYPEASVQLIDSTLNAAKYRGNQ